jgi:hypothetical protein
VDALAGDVARVVGCEEGGGVPDVFRCLRPAEGDDVAVGVLECLVRVEGGQLGLVALEGGRVRVLEWGPYCAGADRVDVDPVGGEGNGQALGVPQQGGLARRVGSGGPAGRVGRHGRDVDDLAVMARPHRRDERLAAADHSLHVDGEGAVPVLLAVPAGGAARVGGNAGVVDQDVESVQPGQDGGHRGVD